MTMVQHLRFRRPQERRLTRPMRSGGWALVLGLAFVAAYPASLRADDTGGIADSVSTDPNSGADTITVQNNSDQKMLITLTVDNCGNTANDGSCGTSSTALTPGQSLNHTISKADSGQPLAYSYHFTAVETP